jgi:hypothetical protein
MTSSSPARVPWWVTLLDIVLVVAVVLLLSALLVGGPRVRFADVRITATSVWKLGAVVLALLALRHAVWRTPSWPGIVRAWGRRVTGSEGVRRAVPWVLTTRLTVLLATYAAVLVIGYPSERPPFRASSSEAGNLLARWDTGWYLGIAEEGYNYWGNANHQTNVAFFPAYPMTVRAVASLIGARWGSPEDATDTFEAFTERRHVRMLQAGWLVSITSLVIGLAYFFRLARELTGSDEAAGQGVALMVTYPFAFFFGAVYTEAFFLACAVAAFYHFRHRQWIWAAVAGLLAGLVRPNGCLLSVPLGVMALQHWRADGYRLPTLTRGLAVASCAGLGMLAFTWWLYAFTGEWFVWMKAHGAWGRQFAGIHRLLAQRWDHLWSLGLYGYSVEYTIELFNMAATSLVLAVSWPVGRRYGWPYALFLLVTVVPPLFMGGFLSMGRVTTTLFPVFIYLGARTPQWALPHVLLVTFGLQVALAVMHFTWRQVY